LGGASEKLSIYSLALDAGGGWIFAGTNDGIYRARMKEMVFKKPSGYRMIPRVSSLLVYHSSPTVVYATTHLGLLRSRDNGATWDILSAGLPIHEGVECLAVNPSDPKHMFAGTPAGLYQSSDGGASWARSPEGRLGVAIPSVIFLDSSGERVLAADNTWGGVFYSSDGGDSWQKISAPEFASPIQVLQQDPTNPSSIYLGTRTEGIYLLHLPESRQ
jgi:ligand-binding sensor domain-containing protein